MRERELCTSPVLPLTTHGTSKKFINLSSVKTPAFCCGQTELPAASSACQSVPSPNSGHFFGLESSSSLFPPDSSSFLLPGLLPRVGWPANTVFTQCSQAHSPSCHSTTHTHTHTRWAHTHTYTPDRHTHTHTHTRQYGPGGQGHFLVLQVPNKESANIFSIIENYL